MKLDGPPHSGGWQADRNPVGGTGDVRGDLPPLRVLLVILIVFLVAAGALIAATR